MNEISIFTLFIYTENLLSIRHFYFLIKLKYTINNNNTFSWPNALNEIRFILTGTVLELKYILNGMLSYDLIVEFRLNLVLGMEMLAPLSASIGCTVNTDCFSCLLEISLLNKYI